MLRDELHNRMIDSIPNPIRAHVKAMLTDLAIEGRGSYRLTDKDERFGYIVRELAKENVNMDAMAIWLRHEGVKCDYFTDTGLIRFDWFSYPSSDCNMNNP